MTAASAKPNRELVVYALYLAGGANGRVHTEDVALKCFELFPDAFSWVKHVQFPDKDIVRVALTDARKDKYGALLSGGIEGHSSQGDPGRDGWILTENGLRWISTNLSRFEDADSAKDRKNHRQTALRTARTLEKTPLYQKFIASPEAFSPSIGELAAALKCRVDANGSVWQKRFDELTRTGINASISQIEEFSTACQLAYETER